MNTASIARIAAWNIIADQELPVGTQVTVRGGQVTIRPRGGQPVSASYGPADTPDSLYDALKNAVQTSAQGSN
jgi:hypothetical protein